MAISGSGYMMIGSKIASMMTKGYSAWEQARMDEAQASYNITILNANQSITEASYQFDIDRIKQQEQVYLGMVRAKQAKSGVLFQGSAIDVYQAGAEAYEMDILRTKWNMLAARYSSDLQKLEQEGAQRSARKQKTFGTINAVLGEISNSGELYSSLKKGSDSAATTAGANSGGGTTGN